MPQHVGTLVKAIQFLNVLGEDGPIGVLALSCQLRMDKSAVLRMLSTLKACDYVRLVEVEDGRSDLGLQLFDCVSQQEVRLGARTGLRCEPWLDVAGKAILAHFDEADVSHLFAATVTTEVRAGRSDPAVGVVGRIDKSSHDRRLQSRTSL